MYGISITKDSIQPRRKEGIFDKLDFIDIKAPHVGGVEAW